MMRRSWFLAESHSKKTDTTGLSGRAGSVVAKELLNY